MLQKTALNVVQREWPPPCWADSEGLQDKLLVTENQNPVCAPDNFIHLHRTPLLSPLLHIPDWEQSYLLLKYLWDTHKFCIVQSEFIWFASQVLMNQKGVCSKSSWSFLPASSIKSGRDQWSFNASTYSSITVNQTSALQWKETKWSLRGKTKTEQKTSTAGKASICRTCRFPSLSTLPVGLSSSRLSDIFYHIYGEIICLKRKCNKVVHMLL